MFSKSTEEDSLAGASLVKRLQIRMRSSADVVVCGAGIAGISAAYHLLGPAWDQERSPR
jgi:ribulose 1,5-bisphosphate synthetase/thiazole synthase